MNFNVRFCSTKFVSWKVYPYFSPYEEKKKKKGSVVHLLTFFCEFFNKIFFVILTQEALEGGVPTEHSVSVLVFQSLLYTMKKSLSIVRRGCVILN